MASLFRCFAVLSLLVACVACGSGGGDKNDDDNDTEEQTPEVAGSAGDYPDDLSESAVLDVPGPAAALADSVLEDQALGLTIAVTSDILAEGGIATRYDGTVTREAKTPISSMYAWPNDVVDMALEASARRSMYTLSLSDFVAMLGQLGFPYPEEVTPSAFWVTFLADWYAAAERSVDAPDAFAVLFIAAMNQRQEPRANIATGIENPDLIRLSVLEMNLLIAAFERVATITAVPTGLRASQYFVRAEGSASPCSDLLKQLGVLKDPASIAVTEAFGEALDSALEHGLGEAGAATVGKILSTLGIAAKVQKVVQQFRYGYVNLALDTPETVRKPRKSEANKKGSMTATAGVDADKLAEAQAARGGAEGVQQDLASKDCMSALGVPVVSDINDIANDAENWRISWSIVAGGGTQVTYEPGQAWTVQQFHQLPLVRASDSEATCKLGFDILPQATDASVGKERTRKAVFKAQLRRGTPPGVLSTAWGTGKAGVAAGNANPIGAILGLTDTITDIVGGWVLEAGSPSAQVTQLLTEIQPTGLIGTVTWTTEGSGNVHVPGMDEDYIDTKAYVKNSGLIEIVSEAGGAADTRGIETCTLRYQRLTSYEDHPEGGNIVGTADDTTTTTINEYWESDPDARSNAGYIQDWDTVLAGLPENLMTPEMRENLGRVTIGQGPGGLCGVHMGYRHYFVRDWEYEDGHWVPHEDGLDEPVAYVGEAWHKPIDVRGEPGAKTIQGSRSVTYGRKIEDFDFVVRESVKWDLHRAE